MPTAKSRLLQSFLALGLVAIGVLALLHPGFAILDPTGFPPRWHCGNWTAALGWMHICSDLLIWVAYTAIPVMIILIVRRQTDIVFPRVFWLFAVFILACGATHLIEAVIFWWPVYRLSAFFKVATAIASVITVFALISVISRALALPSRMADIQSIIENAPTAMLVVDCRGKIVMVNLQTENLFGFDRRELIGQRVEMLLPPRFREDHPQLFQSYFAEPTTMQLGEGRELYGHHKEGHDIPVEIGLTPLKLNNEQAVLACLVNQTIRRRHREKELSELSHVLSLGEVVGGLAHELNTPIQRIVTWTRVLQHGAASEDHQGPIQRIEMASKEVGEIVHRLRDAVVRRDKIEHPLNLNKVILDTITLMHREVTGIRTDLEDDLPYVLGDPVQLQLVLSNLIRNAYQAGGPVTITTRTLNDQIVCSIDDCGSGFTVDPKQLFDSFYTTKIGGLGMGLTITQAILRRYGGRIIAHKKDRGARFEFTLPLEP